MTKPDCHGLQVHELVDHLTDGKVPTESLLPLIKELRKLYLHLVLSDVDTATLRNPREPCHRAALAEKRDQNA